MSRSLRLMTANLLHDRGDAGSFRSLVQTVAPDVLVTQELSPACAEVLSDLFDHHHLRPAHGFAGRGIATRLPAHFGDIDMPARPGTWAVIAVEKRLLRIVGMHLVNPIKFPWWRSHRSRSRQLDALFEWVSAGDGDFPLLVAGDMNASPRWPAYRRMADRWSDLALELAREDGAVPERTWAWRPGWPRLLRIDHVFGSGVVPASVSVLPITGSDHHAVVLDFQLAPEAT